MTTTSITTLTTWQHRLGPALGPISRLYGMAMELREKLYRDGTLKVWRPPAPTVSVGNIGWGGSGKTPLAGWLLGWMEAQGLEPLLLTRGYRAKPPRLPYSVHSASPVIEAGDEPLMLAREHERARIVVDPDRTRGGLWAFRNFKPDMVVLDDGFQHLAVARDLDLVLLKPEDLYREWNKVIPGGSWREAASALERADAFFIKCPADVFQRLDEPIRRHLSDFGKPVFNFELRPTGILRVEDNAAFPHLDGGRYLLVTGVGDPAQVRATAEAHLGYGPVKHMIFADHHGYSSQDVQAIADTAQRLDCQAVLTTPKDGVKLSGSLGNLLQTFDLTLAFGAKRYSEHTFETWWQHRAAALLGRPE